MTIDPDAPPRPGGRQCGQVRYALDAPLREIFIRHCTECRKQSASAFGVSLIARSADVRLISGELKLWSRPTDSGGVLNCYFCPDCGGRVWHENPDAPGMLSFKGGGLDVMPDLSAAPHIRTASKAPGVTIPSSARSFPGEPA